MSLQVGFGKEKPIQQNQDKVLYQTQYTIPLI